MKSVPAMVATNARIVLTDNAYLPQITQIFPDYYCKQPHSGDITVAKQRPHNRLSFDQGGAVRPDPDPQGEIAGN
jgi:hypothetical protein